MTRRGGRNLRQAHSETAHDDQREDASARTVKTLISDFFAEASGAEEANLLILDDFSGSEVSRSDDINFEGVNAETESDSEDLFGENIHRYSLSHADNCRDYEAVSELDHYDTSMLDESVQRELRPEQRRRVEEELDVRDRLTLAASGGGGRTAIPSVPGFGENVWHCYNTYVDDEEDEMWRMLRERRERLRERTDQAGLFPVQQAEQAKEELPYCQNESSWTSRVAEILIVVFTGFLSLYRRPTNILNSAAPGTQTNFEDEQQQQQQTEGHGSEDEFQQGTYMEKLSDMIHADLSSIMVSWDDLRHYCPKILDWLYHVPSNTLNVLDLATTAIVQERYQKLYAHRRISCRIRGYTAVDTIRSLSTNSLHRLVCFRAVVIRMSNVQPKLKLAYYECGRCHCNTNGPYEIRDGESKIKRICEECQSPGPFVICREKTLYENYQRLFLQQPPDQVTPGHLPRQKEAILVGDLVETMRPGEEVLVTGIHQTKPDARLNARYGFPIMQDLILVNNLERRSDIQIEEITDDDFQIIHKLSKNPHIREKLIDSIAPSIWGHRHAKTGLAYAMFGGVRRQSGGSHEIRGDINFLMLGDPGMGKSQFLKYVEKTFDRTVYTTGKGASAVGLTAAVRKDPITREWTLEGGGLVLADEGICLIDEFDKMSDQDRVSIHEAMEQQTISISKAGICTTLRARCSVIAAANPMLGRYDNSLTFSENVDLSDAILSRFDILAVLKDQVNPTQDENLAEYVVGTHFACHPQADVTDVDRERQLCLSGLADPEEDLDIIDVNAKYVTGPGRIPQSILKKYIIYARTHCYPELRIHDENKLARFYSDIRQASMNGGGMPMTIRHLESIVRMASANAKMRLAHSVERCDMDYAISTMLEAFIESQKYAVAANLGRRFGRFRALASSPDEFLESVLIDLLSRKRKELLRKFYKGSIPATLGTEAATVMKSALVSLTEWTTVVRAMYSIPPAAVAKFTKSRRFSAQYSLVVSGKNGKKIRSGSRRKN